MRPFRPPVEPRATQIIVALCFALQLLLSLFGASASQFAYAHFALIPQAVHAAWAGDGYGGAYVGLVSSIFLHAGWTHLLFNMLFFFWVGRAVEWILGGWRLVALFLLGGVMGGLAQIWADPLSGVPVVGASGAISAIFAAYALLFAQRRVAARQWMGVRWSGALLNALWVAAFWIGLQLAIGLLLSGPDGEGIAIWAHIAGFLTGLILTHIYARLRLKGGSGLNA